MYLSSFQTSFPDFHHDSREQTRVPTWSVFANLSPAVSPCYCVCFGVFCFLACIVPSKVCLLGTLPYRPSHSPSPGNGTTARRETGESRSYIFEAVLQVTSLGFVVPFSRPTRAAHDRHVHSIQVDTHDSHTQTNTKLETRKQIWGVNAVAREREHWCDKYSGSPLLLFIFFQCNFFLRVWTKNISNVRFFFPHTIIYPMPIEYVLQPYVVVLQFGKGCRVLLLYITCFMAAVSLTKQDGGTIDFQTAAHSSLQ